MLNLRAGFDTLRHWNSNARSTAAHERRVDQAELAELRRRRPDVEEIIAALDREGVFAIENYWSVEKCAEARADIEQLIADYPDAVQSFSGGSDKRMFGSEARSSVIAEFYNDPFLRGVGEQISGFSLYNFATLAARIDATPENNGSGDGWHRDAHGYQYKSILYLCDVDDSNGPFEYAPGSHRCWRAALEAALGGLPPPPNTRYDAKAVDAFVRRFRFRTQKFFGKAGTLLLAITAGLHRGRPLQAGTRYALTNYFYHPFQIDENKLNTFPEMLPGAADRVRKDLFAS